MNWRFEEVRRVREKTLSMVSTLSQDQFDFRSGADRWSAGEIVDHLVKANRMYLGEIGRLVALKRAGKRPEIYVSLSEMEFKVPLLPRFLMPFADLPVGIFNSVLPGAVREMFLRTTVVPAEAPEVLKPRSGRAREDLLADLQQALVETEHMLLDNMDLDLGELRYYHPLFGFNGVDGILGLMASHEQRHHKQLARALAELPAPARAGTTREEPMSDPAQ